MSPSRAVPAGLGAAGLLAVLVALLAPEASRAVEAGDLGQRLAAEAFIDLAGGVHRLAELEGQVLLVDFWATWCLPCRAEVPDLKALHARVDGPTVVGVNLDRQAVIERVVAMVEELDMDYPVWRTAEERELSHFGLVSLPFYAVLDPEGAVVWTHAGSLHLVEVELEEALVAARESLETSR